MCRPQNALNTAITHNWGRVNQDTAHSAWLTPALAEAYPCPAVPREPPAVAAAGAADEGPQPYEAEAVQAFAERNGIDQNGKTVQGAHT